MKFPAILLLLLPTVLSVRLNCEDSSDGQSEALISCSIQEFEEDLNITGTTIHPDYFYELKLEDVTLPVLPETFFEQIEKLRSFKAQNCGVEQIDGTFTSARHLRKLYLSNNSIESLNVNTFAGARDLGLLDLAYNRISSVGQGTFNKLKYLSHVNLSHNQIESVDTDLFKQNEILNSLDLSFNQLKSLEINVCQLASIYASFNMIENVQLQLVEVSQNMQYYSRFLVKMFLNNNAITNFKIDKGFKIRQLSLDHNLINDLSHLSERLPDQIEILDLSYNDLDPLTQETFKHFYNLRSLYLKSANVRFYDDLVFANCVNLTELDLSFNQLREFDSNLVENLNSIELLKIDGNNLTRFNVQKLPKRVFAISLYDNDWDCDYLEELFEQMRLHGKVVVPSIDLLGDEPQINGVNCAQTLTTTVSEDEIEHSTSSAADFE